jgi:hypothetical protein
MSSVEDSFTKLLRMQPSDQEKQTLLRTRDALNLKNNDALWLVLIVLGHYETLYSRFPSLIEKAAASVTERVKAAAEAELKAATARTHAELAKSVAQTANDIADHAASAKRSTWFAVAFTVAASMLMGIGVGMFRVGVSSGRSAGEHEGYLQARSEKAAESWANTPEGQLGFRLAEVGSLRELATCSGKILSRKGDTCFVKVGKESVLGWALPPESRPKR